MFHTVIRILPAALPLLAVPIADAQSSTPGAWQALFAQAGQRCVAASGLLDATASAQPMDFEDEVLVLVDGMWPQPHMKQAPAQMLCRYNKTSGDVKLIELPADWRPRLQR